MKVITETRRAPYLDIYVFGIFWLFDIKRNLSLDTWMFFLQDKHAMS